MRRTLPMLAIAALFASQSAAAVTITSDFSTGVDSWKTRDFFTGELGPTPNWTLNAIEAKDTGDFMIFSAPGPKFTGDKGAFFGGTFSFDLVTNHRSANTAGNFTLAIGTGSLTLPGSTVLYWYGGQPSTTEYTHFIGTLAPNDGRWRIGGGPSGGGLVPTENEFRSVLNDVSFVYIPIEWNDGPDSSRLDNVMLTALPVPEQPTLVLMAIALGGFGKWALRRSKLARTEA